MKARICNKTVSIPDERVRGGESRQARAEESVAVSQPPGATPSPLIITLNGQIPSGKNQVRTAWTQDKKRPGKMKPHKYPDKRFESWRSMAVSQICMALGMERAAMTGPVSLIADYVPGDLIKRDVDGMLSAIFHVIVKAGILLDDAQVKNVQWHQWPLDRKQPKCRVVIEEIGGRS